MKYLELIAIEKRMYSNREYLKELISYIDENGYRKLDPYYYLSAEVAAYKLLCYWIKHFDLDNEVIDDKQLEALDFIDTLINKGYKEDYEYYESELNVYLWHMLLQTIDSKVAYEIHIELFCIAHYIEIGQGTPKDETAFMLAEPQDLSDANQVSYVYSIVHDYLFSLSHEERIEFVENGLGLSERNQELYKLHFGLF